MGEVPNKKGVTITATELKQNLGKYLDYVCEQNDVVIKKNGNKIARLTPYVTDIEQYFTIRENALDYQYGGKRVTYEEFLLIDEKSTIQMELINGEIYLMSSPNLWHQEILGRLHIDFNRYFLERPCKVFFAPYSITFYKRSLDEPDVLQPDLFVACDLEENIDKDGRYKGVPSLVVEILSKSTRSKDMVDKLNSYMLSGVKEYYIIDPFNEKIMFYQFEDFDIENLQIYSEKMVLKSAYFESLVISVEDIFKGLAGKTQ